MVRNLTVRHKVNKATRDYFDARDFIEIETPVLSKSTPEGAREFLVPAPNLAKPLRNFLLLQYKQLLMVGGGALKSLCFRDEDPRRSNRINADRRGSFLRDREGNFELIEGLLAQIFLVVAGGGSSSVSSDDVSRGDGRLRG